ncbi:centromere-associated protein E isoform X2 [Xenopus laevis]|uniref:Centromere-associated protein E n=1 Tax=Xenopus laevis TaxID=8355 RepID=A0A8J0UHB0_XENLA|nr:centromere-associated protein E isoform X2 [Xenopus laevis]
MSEGDAVKVCVRVRPLIQREQGDQANLQWKAGNNTISQVDGTKSFNFDRVFNSHESTSQVYQEIAVPIIRSALQGYNGTIFAYGQTSSGKTYTMMGTPNSLGIIPQAIQEVFKIIQEIPNREFLLRVSYMEIYNETVKDLLCDDRRKKPLEIREDFNRNVYVADLTEELVMVPEHVIQWIKKGEKNRHYGETKMNDHSSRSHTIFRMIVESRDRNDPTNSENCDGAVMVSHLNLVDLAGSERASQTGAEGVRLKEGCNINRSLFILGQVIKKLSDGQAGGFINYRDSKLTRILQNSLGGNAKTVIICTITPVSFDETLSTLQFASTAKHVRNTPHVNEVLDDEALLKRYRKEILDLKKQLENLESSSETKAQAMAKEEHTQLLAEIKQLHKEREDRIWHLTNIVVASSQESQQDQRVKRKRRVTWAPGKIQNSLHASGVSDFDMLSRLPGNFSKKAKFSDMPSFPEIDDSVCTEFSDFDDALSMMDSNGIDAEWNLASKVTHREKTSLHQSMIDFGQISDSVQFHDSSKENQLQYLAKDSGDMAECRKASFEKEITSLQQQLQSKEEEKKELVQSFELKIAELEEQLSVKAKNLEMVTNSREHSINAEVQTDVEKEVVRKEMSVLGDSGYNASSSDLQDSSVDGKRLSSSHDECIEHRKMLEQKIADLEEFIENIGKKSENDKQKSNEQDFMESIQLCEALMAEKANAFEELALMRDNFDSVILENETLKREIADLERSLKENQETNEFEILEKETQKEHEAQLIHEIANLKKLIENAEMYNQNLEEDLDGKTKLLKEQEIQLAELRKHTDNLQKKVRNFDLSVSMGDSEKLCEEVFQLKHSLSDAEAVTRDAQKECAFLRSENLELKQKMEDTSAGYNQKEKVASLFEKQLETEKSNYKKMQADLQKELQSAFNEINYLNGLLAGKVPKDLLSRVELEKNVSECSKQLEKALEEKNALANEVTSLKDQISKASEEIMLLKCEGEHSTSTISKQELVMQEQSQLILKLTDEVTHAQSKVQQAEEQYLEMKKMHEELYENYICRTEETTKNKNEAEELLGEIENLKGTMESVEVELADAKRELEETLRDKEQLLQEMQTVFAPLSDSLPSSTLVEEKSQDPIQIDDYHKLIALAKESNSIMVCLETERNSLKEKVNVLTAQLQSLQEQSIAKSDLQKEKQDLEERESKLISEMEKLQKGITDSPLSIQKLQLENLDVTEKLQTLQEEIKSITIERNGLQTNLEDLKAERESLKQDLSENIEQSIETQDELRAAQEELRAQKQLVDSLRQQLVDCVGDISSPNHDATAEQEKMSLFKENLEQNEILRGERDELQTSCKALVSELELLRAHVKSVEGENLEVTQKLHALEKEILGKSEEREALQSMLKSLKEDNNKLKEQAEEYCSKINELTEELQLFSERDMEKEGYVELKQLQEKMMATVQEKEELQEIIGSLRAERDELRLNLQENIEMSIETQDELRNVLDELKKKTQLLDEIKSQELKHDSVQYSAELAEERANTQLQNQLDEKLRKIEEQENLLKSISENLQDTSSKYENALETLELVTMEKDQLLLAFDSLKLTSEIQTRELESYKQEAFPCTNVQECEQSDAQEENAAKKAEELEHQLSKTLDMLKEEGSKYETAKETLALVNGEKEQILSDLESLKLAHDLVVKELELYRQEDDGSVAQLEKETVRNNRLQCQVDKEQKRVQELENQLIENANILREVETKYETAMENLDLLQREKDQLLLRLDALKEKSATTEKEFVTYEQEKRNGLEEEFSGLQKLVDEIEILKAQLKATEERLDIKDRAYFELVQTRNTNISEENLETAVQADSSEGSNDQHSVEQDRSDQSSVSEMKVLEEKLERNQYLLERLQEEKLEMSNKLEILQKELETSVLLKDDLQQRLECLLNENNILKDNIETTLKHHSDTQDQLQKTQQELELQLADNLASNASANSPITQEKETSTDCVHPLEEKILLLTEELQQKTSEQDKLLHEKKELEQAQVKLKCEVEHLMKSSMESQSSLESVQHEKHDTEQQLLALKQQMQVVTQEMEELQQTHENLIAEMDQLKGNLKENIELGLNFKDELQQKTTKEQCLLNENQELEQSQHRLKCEIEELTKSLKDKEAAVETLKESEQKVINLSQEMETVMLEMEELKNSQMTVIAERDQLQEDLRENVEMSIETQDDLRKAQEALQQQKDKVQELTSQISVLEEKISLLENQMLHNVTTIKETLTERDDLNQSKQHLFSEIETLSLSLKEKDFALEQAEKEKADAARKIIDLTEKISTIEEQLLQHATDLKETLYERESLIQCKEQLALDMEHLREELKSKDLAFGEIEQERDEAADKVIALTEKISSLEEQISQNVTTLKEAIDIKETFSLSNQQFSSQIEELRESLKTKDLQLQEAEKEMGDATNQIKILTARICSLDEEILENAGILNEAVSERKNLSHSKQQLASELEQLALTLKSRDHALEQANREKDEAANKVASLTDEIKILSKEMDEFRDSKESLQEQSSHLSEELCTYKTELQMLKQQKEDINNKLAEKVKEVDELLQHLSSLKEQLDQIQMELRNEKLRNYELCEKMDIMEKEISVLRLMQNEPQQEEDDVAERMDILESRNQEIQELMEKISAVYSEQHTLLSSLSSELQKETEAHKHCMLNIKESLSSTLSRSFGSLQTEHVKLNTQLQTLLNKFKVVYRTAAVKEDHSLIKDYEKDLAAEQKRHDELRLQLQCLEQHGRKWSDSASEELKFCEIEFLNELLFKKANIIQSVQDDFSEVQVFLNQVGSTLQEELEHKKGFMQWLEEFGDLHVDAKKLSEGMQQENRRIASTIQLLTKRLKAVVQSKIQREITVYLNQFEAKLQEKKEQNKELMRRMEHHGPSASVMEEENARLLGILKTVQDESKKLQSRIKMLENELNLVKDDAMHKGEKVAILQDKLLSRNAEAELNAMQVKLTKKQDNLQAAMKEIENLQKMVAKGAVPYKEEIDNLKTKVVKIEMEKIKYSKATDQEIAYLKSCLEDKEEGLRRLKEELRRAQADNDTTVCVPKDYQKASTFPVTCGGGSGIVQSTAMLVLQSEKAALERELSHYKKKYHHLSRTMSSSEDRKKTKAKSDAHSSHTGSSHRGSPHKTETYRHGPVTPERSEMPSLHLGSPKKSESSTKRVVSPNRSEIYSQLVMSPGKTGMHKHILSPSKVGLHKKRALSPNRSEMPTQHVISPGKTGLHKNLTESTLFDNLSSPCKQQKVQENLNSPKGKLFDVKSKSMPYCPSQFFDNSKLGDFSELNTAESNDKSQAENWWYEAKKETAPECKTS